MINWAATVVLASLASNCALAATEPITLPDSALATVAGTVFSGTVYIAGVFFVDDDVLFQNAQVFMAGAQIVELQEAAGIYQ